MKRRTWYLMRHGETDLNKARCFYGSEDVSINELGVKQAQKINRLMSSKVVTEVYISGLKRSRETAEIVFPEHRMKTLSSLNERPFGRWEGMNADEIQAAFPLEWSKWLEEPFEFTPIGAEPFSSFKTRVWKMASKLLQKKGDIGIVAHLGVLRLIYQYLVDHQADFWDIDIPQGTVLVLEEIDGKWKASYLGRRIHDD